MPTVSKKSFAAASRIVTNHVMNSNGSDAIAVAVMACVEICRHELGPNLTVEGLTVTTQQDQSLIVTVLASSKGKK